MKQNFYHAGQGTQMRGGEIAAHPKGAYGATVEQAWIEALLSLGLDPQGRSTIDEIIASHSAPDRHYHNLQHLSEMLSFLRAPEVILVDRTAVIFAVLFHDFIYDSKAQDNEEQSAHHATEKLKQLGVPERSVKTAKALVLTTKRHQRDPSQPDSAIFLDADLSVLSAAPERYAEYSAAIRREYSWVTDKNYAEGRSKVLQSFLDRDRIYFSDLATQSREALARRNLERELQTLKSAHSGVA